MLTEPAGLSASFVRWQLLSQRKPRGFPHSQAARPAFDAKRPEEQSAANGERPPALSGQSYWLDLWLFVLFDVALFVFIYLLP
uniref:Uncharacterized protein n=1 Tax=Phasianus colchicus TaxID=9054 RepID=A0A669Q499_PHACC